MKEFQVKEFNDSETEIIPPKTYEVGGSEMLDLAESNPQEFLLKYGVEPAVELLKQGRDYYGKIVVKSERSEADYDAFFEKWKKIIGYDPNVNPSGLPWMENVRDKYHQALSPGFCQFTKKKDYPTTGQEVRVYLSVKQDYVLDLLEQLAGHFDKLPNLFAFKINISDAERNENAVLYLTENATRAEIDDLLQVVADLRKHIHGSQEVFNGYDFVTPFSRPIIDSQTQANIGQIAFNPFKSSKGKVELGYLGSAQTINQLFARLVELVQFHQPEKNPPEQIAQTLAEETQVTCRFGDGNEDKIMSLSQYCQLCLKKISDIMNS